jgi:hypothetical protein
MEKDLVKTCIETLGLTVGYKDNPLLQDLQPNLNAGSWSALWDQTAWASQRLFEPLQVYNHLYLDKSL